MAASSNRSENLIELIVLNKAKKTWLTLAPIAMITQTIKNSNLAKNLSAIVRQQETTLVAVEQGMQLVRASSNCKYKPKSKRMVKVHSFYCIKRTSNYMTRSPFIYLETYMNKRKIFRGQLMAWTLEAAKTASWRRAMRTWMLMILSIKSIHALNLKVQMLTCIKIQVRINWQRCLSAVNQVYLLLFQQTTIVTMRNCQQYQH